MLIELSTTGVDPITPTKTESNPACINFGIHKKIHLKKDRTHFLTLTTSYT